MNTTFARVIFPVVSYIKQKIDKLYFSTYNVRGRENMIRNMFPWHDKIDDYARLTSYIERAQTKEITTLKEILMSYYWNQVAELVTQGNLSDLAKFEGILRFVEVVSTYKEYSLTIK